MKKILLLVVVFILSISVTYAKAFYNGKLPLPGASRADINLQSDTFMDVYSAASLKVTDCSKFAIIDTAILKQPHEVEKNGSKFKAWSEQWTVKACGQKVFVPIEFLTKESDTTHVIENSRVHF